MLKETVKRRTKNTIQKIAPSMYKPVIVASMGRSGSTLVFDALRKSMAEARFGFFCDYGLRLVTDAAWDLGNKHFYSGVVYKTHGFAHELPPSIDANIIFLFGSATDAALSVLSCHDRYGDGWIKEHFRHLNAKGSFADLGDHDVLRFEDQLNSWTSVGGVQRLILKYDAIWEHEDTISEYCGFPVKLPEKRQRSGASAAAPDIKRHFTETYSRLDALVEAMPSCRIIT